MFYWSTKNIFWFQYNFWHTKPQKIENRKKKNKAFFEKHVASKQMKPKLNTRNYHKYCKENAIQVQENIFIVEKQKQKKNTRKTLKTVREHKYIQNILPQKKKVCPQVKGQTAWNFVIFWNRKGRIRLSWKKIQEKREEEEENENQFFEFLKEYQMDPLETTIYFFSSFFFIIVF